MVAPDDPRIEMCGYAKLFGDGLEYYMKKYEIILGRTSKSGQTDVVLGDNMNISRQHAKIVFNFENKTFELVVMGKNGVTVGTTLYTPTSAPYPLKSQDVIAVGDKVFHFLLPKPIDKIRKRDLEALTVTANKRPRTATSQQQPTAGSAPSRPPSLPGTAPAPAAAMSATPPMATLVPQLHGGPMQPMQPMMHATLPVHGVLPGQAMQPMQPMMHMGVAAGHPGAMLVPQGVPIQPGFIPPRP